MPERTLRDCHILVAEDEYLLADELRTELLEAGAVVIGPAATLADAIALLQDAPRVDGAVLDLNLGGEMAYPLADLLLGRNAPFIFTTGYDATAIPARFSSAPRCEKPVDMKRVAQAIGRVIHDAA